MKFKKHIILIFTVIFHTNIYCQSSESKTKFPKETNINFKIGGTINGINKTLYKTLNDGLSINKYEPTNTTYFINPYASVGFEYHFKEHVALNFNMGFYQTLQKYKTVENYNLSNPATLNTNNIVYETAAETQYLNNNVFLEVLPTYVYNRSRVLLGLNVTRTSPTVSTVVTVRDNTGIISRETIKDKPEESYHLYTSIGIMQGFPVKSYELTISLSYFGLLKKYDSGVNVALGFMF